MSNALENNFINRTQFLNQYKYLKTINLFVFKTR